jgi:protein-disulfide isomerase
MAAPMPARVLRKRFRTKAALAWVGVIVLGLGAVYTIARFSSPESVTGHESAMLASTDAPTRGAASARVHIVEFLDPACETCAYFYPLVERLLEQNPGKVRLSIRHVAFHDGSELAVRVLEASRNQDKYWDMLDALLSTQRYWTPQHKPRPDRIRRVASMVDLDRSQLEQDLYSPKVNERIIRDRNAARALNVIVTPSFFVNGKAPTRIGDTQLRGLIANELRDAY